MFSELEGEVKGKELGRVQLTLREGGRVEWDEGLEVE